MDIVAQILCEHFLLEKPLPTDVFYTRSKQLIQICTNNYLSLFRSLYEKSTLADYPTYLSCMCEREIHFGHVISALSFGIYIVRQVKNDVNQNIAFISKAIDDHFSLWVLQQGGWESLTIAYTTRNYETSV